MVLLDIVTKLFGILWWVVELLFPVKFTVIEDGEGGVRYCCGRPTKELTPTNGLCGTGLHFATSLMRTEKGASVGKPVQMEAVNVFTSEGVPMTLWAAVTYDIIDYPKAARQYDLDERVQEVVTADLLARFVKIPLADAIGSMVGVETSLMKAMTTTLAPLGVAPSSKPRITGREIGEDAIARAYLVDVMEDVMGCHLNTQQKTAIIAGASIMVDAEPEDEDEQQ